MTQDVSQPIVASSILSVSSIITTVTEKFDDIESNIIVTVLAWFKPELVKLGIAEIAAIGASLKHFLDKLRAGIEWGTAMAGMLTELWNGTVDNLRMLVTDIVEAVGKMFEKVGLV